MGVVRQAAIAPAMAPKHHDEGRSHVAVMDIPEMGAFVCSKSVS